MPSPSFIWAQLCNKNNKSQQTLETVNICTFKFKNNYSTMMRVEQYSWISTSGNANSCSDLWRNYAWVQKMLRNFQTSLTTDTFVDLPLCVYSKGILWNNSYELQNNIQSPVLGIQLILKKFIKLQIICL